MQDCWYGDKRDLAKWSVLINLSREESTNRIFWVVFYQSDPLRQQKVKFDEREMPIPNEVWQHFRNVDRIAELDQRTGVRIEVFKKPWDENRNEYIEAILRRIYQGPKEPMLVFLDPDTGLGGETAKTPQHVRPDEVKSIFGAMRAGDSLVFYQHAQRRKDWCQQMRRAFAEAIGILPSRVVAATSEIAGDVVFFVVHKTEGQGTSR